MTLAVAIHMNVIHIEGMHMYIKSLLHVNILLYPNIILYDTHTCT